MRMALAIILIILWLLGVVGTYAVGRSVDVLLVIAVILLVFELRQGAV